MHKQMLAHIADYLGLNKHISTDGYYYEVVDTWDEELQYTFNSLIGLETAIERLGCKLYGITFKVYRVHVKNQTEREQFATIKNGIIHKVEKYETK